VVSNPSWEYLNGLGDIDFMNEVVFGRTNANTIKKKGWELDFYDILSLRGGRFEEDRNKGNRRFDTFGYGIRFSGFAKVLLNEYPNVSSNKVLNFIMNHLDFQYNHSELSADERGSPLAGTTFNSGILTLKY
jgi:hypothetical protein